MTSEEQLELKNIIEAALFASDEPLSINQLMGLFPEQARPLRNEVQDAVSALIGECEGRGIEVKRVSGGYRAQTRERYAPWLRKLFAGRAPRYSRALLETLAIIAYRQPVTRGDIEEIRGVSVSSDIIRHLSERKWIKEVGRRDVPGHPALLATTPEFLAYFNLKSLKELPALLDKRDTLEIARELNLRLPLEAEEGAEETDSSGDEPEIMDEVHMGSTSEVDVLPLSDATVPASDETRDATGERKAP